MPGQYSPYGPGGGGGNFGPGAPPDDESQCWFCLSSPKADVEMVVSIGEEIYMSVPKVGMAT